MTTEKLVMNSLFGKTELASVKVELGVVEDIAKIAADGNQILKILANDKLFLQNADKNIQSTKIQAERLIEAVMKEADRVVGITDKNAQKALALLPKIGTILDKADQAAKGLGLDSKGITGYSDLDKLYFALEAAQKEVGLGYKFQN